MVVIAIIGILAATSLASISKARESAQYTKARVDIKQLADLAEFAKGTNSTTLMGITGSVCSECACRTSGVPTTIRLEDLPSSQKQACFQAYYQLIERLGEKTSGLLSIENPQLDPWGGPYLINENEGEGTASICFTDNITSAGPNGLYYDTDDITYNMPSSLCPNPISHHPNTNWYSD